MTGLPATGSWPVSVPGVLAAPGQGGERETISRPPRREAEAGRLAIFGATGDLTRRKLLPVLHDLQCLGGMSSRFEIIGTGRTRLTDEQFRDRCVRSLAESRDAVDAKHPRSLRRLCCRRFGIFSTCIRESWVSTASGAASI